MSVFDRTCRRVVVVVVVVVVTGGGGGHVLIAGPSTLDTLSSDIVYFNAGKDIPAKL